MRQQAVVWRSAKHLAGMSTLVLSAGPCTTWSISLFQPEVLFVLGLYQKWLFGSLPRPELWKVVLPAVKFPITVILHFGCYLILNIDITCSLIVMNFKSVFIIQVSIIPSKRLIVQSSQGPSYPFAPILPTNSNLSQHQIYARHNFNLQKTKWGPADVSMTKWIRSPLVKAEDNVWQKWFKKLSAYCEIPPSFYITGQLLIWLVVFVKWWFSFDFTVTLWLLLAQE